MGSCMSCKAGKEAYARTSCPASPYPNTKLCTMDWPPPMSQNETKGLVKQGTAYSRGQATLFGFKRRPVSALARSSHGTGADTISNRTQSQESVGSISSVPSGRSTPWLANLNKDVESNTNRFGFRGSSAAAITNKVSDSNYNNSGVTQSSITNHSVNILKVDKPRAKGGGKSFNTLVSKIKPAASTVMNSGNDGNKNHCSLTAQSEGIENMSAARFTLHTSLLPKAQFPIRLTSADNVTTGTSKVTKTAVNNTRKVSRASEDSSSKEGSLNEDSGISSQLGGAVGETDTLHGIEQLDSSPTFGHCRRNAALKPSPLEVVLNGKSFLVRDLKDDRSATDDPNVITEISLISIPTYNSVTGTVHGRSCQYQKQIATCDRITDSSWQQHDSALPPEEHREECADVEEKVYLDSSNSEKTVQARGFLPEDQDWGHGEAMAEECSTSSDDNLNSSPQQTELPNILPTACAITNVSPARPFILMMEEPRFAAIAATASLIDDEKSPVDSLLSNSPGSSTVSEDVLEDGNLTFSHKDSQIEGSVQHSNNTLSPTSPGTPTNASNSLSLSEGRDFLIDDEIADQPGLTFGEGTGNADMMTSSMCLSSQLLSVTENTATLVDTPPKPNSKQPAAVCVDGSPTRGQRVSRADSLSSCESIASDDLMMDYERSEGSAADSLTGILKQLDEASIISDMETQGDDVIREWSSLLGTAGLVTGRAGRLLRSHPSSTPESPRSFDSRPGRPTGNALRAPRQVSVGSDSDDGSIRLDRASYQYMFQDIVSIKTMLLKLKRVLQEAETLNPFDTSLKNGLFLTMASNDTSCVPEAAPGELTDLRRQVIFLQQQLDEKEHTIIQLQGQAARAVVSTQADHQVDTCNATTQTERMRPVSGPSLLQSLPPDNSFGPLVSWTDHHSWSKQPGECVPCRKWSSLPLANMSCLHMGTVATRKTQPSSAHRTKKT